MHRPKRIILIRHGESEAQMEHSLYCKVPNSQIGLTEKGHEQATNAGLKLKELIGNENIRFYFSPFLRARQTYENIIKSFGESDYTALEDPRIREQEQGNLQSKSEETNDQKIQLKKQLGQFFYRYSKGESCADVYERCTELCSNMPWPINEVFYNAIFQMEV